MREEEIVIELKEIRKALEQLSKSVISLCYQILGVNSDDDQDKQPIKTPSSITSNPPDNFGRYVG